MLPILGKSSKSVAIFFLRTFIYILHDMKILKIKVQFINYIEYNYKKW